MTKAGVILAEFDKVKTILAEALGVDKSIALEVALGLRADEIYQDTVQNAFHKVRAIMGSKHTPDQAYVHTSLSNKPKIDKKYTSTNPSNPKILKSQRDEIHAFNAQRRKERADGSANDRSKDTYVARTDDFNAIPVTHNDYYPEAQKALKGRNTAHLRMDGKVAILASGEDDYVDYRNKVTPYHQATERLPISVSERRNKR